jgi:hypothetical protein
MTLAVVVKDRRGKGWKRPELNSLMPYAGGVPDSGSPYFVKKEVDLGS